MKWGLKNFIYKKSLIKGYKKQSVEQYEESYLIVDRILQSLSSKFNAVKWKYN